MAENNNLETPNTPITPITSITQNDSRSGEIIDIHSPYYINPTDTPTTVMIHPPLDGVNYQHWSNLFVLALSVRNKEGFINGTEKKPDVSDPRYTSWMRCNNLVLSWLIYSINGEIGSNIDVGGSAHEAWEKLKACYSQPDKMHIFQLQQDIARLIQSELYVNEYITKLNGLLNELKNFRPTLGCECGKCPCKSLRDQAIVQQEDNVFKFLMGLTTAYENVRGQVILMEPIPTLEKAYSLVLQEERHKQARNHMNTGVESMAMATSQNVGVKRKNVICGHCKKPGHFVDTCYRIHGFPKDFKFTKTPTYGTPGYQAGKGRNFYQGNSSRSNFQTVQNVAALIP